MTSNVLRRSLLVATIALVSVPPAARAQGHQPKKPGGVTPQTELCGTAQNPCQGVWISSSLLTDTVQAETAHSYIVTIGNPTTATATIALQCHTVSAQLPCTGAGDI